MPRMTVVHAPVGDPIAALTALLQNNDCGYISTFSPTHGPEQNVRQSRLLQACLLDLRRPLLRLNYHHDAGGQIETIYVAYMSRQPSAANGLYAVFEALSSRLGQAIFGLLDPNSEVAAQLNEIPLVKSSHKAYPETRPEMVWVEPPGTIMGAWGIHLHAQGRT